MLDACFWPLVCCWQNFILPVYRLENQFRANPVVQLILAARGHRGGVSAVAFHRPARISNKSICICARRKRDRSSTSFQSTRTPEGTPDVTYQIDLLPSLTYRCFTSRISWRMARCNSLWSPFCWEHEMLRRRSFSRGHLSVGMERFQRY